MLVVFTDLRLLSDMGRYFAFYWTSLTLFCRPGPNPRDALIKFNDLGAATSPRHYIRRSNRLCALVSRLGRPWESCGYIQSSYARRFSFAGWRFIIPKVAVVPIFVLWFGQAQHLRSYGDGDLHLPDCVLNIATGLAKTEPDLEDVLKKRLAHPSGNPGEFGLPRTMPYFFCGTQKSRSQLAFG